MVAETTPPTGTLTAFAQEPAVMPAEMHAPVRVLVLKALRAVAANAGGLRTEARPSIMPMLVETGLDESRATRGPGRTRSAWYLMHAGRQLLSHLGRHEVRAD